MKFKKKVDYEPEKSRLSYGSNPKHIHDISWS